MAVKALKDVSMQEVGWSGIERSGQQLIGLDFNPTFDSLESAIEEFDKMYLSESQVSASFHAISRPIANAHWYFTEGDDEVIRYLEGMLFSPRSSVRWKTFLLQATLHVLHGFSVFEKKWKRLSDGDLVIEKLAHRKATSIWGWDFKEKSGKETDDLQAIIQKPRNNGSAVLDTDYPRIDVEHAVHFVFNQQGNSPQGESCFRPSWPPYYFKDVIRRLALIRQERWGAGIPDVEYDEMMSEDASYARGEEIAKDLRSHESAYIVRPKGITVGMVQSPKGTNASEMLDLMRYFDHHISSATMSQFLNVGLNDIASASIESLIAMYIINMQCIADCMAEVIEKDIARHAVDVKFGSKTPVPQCRVSNIGIEHQLAKMINAMSQASQNGLLEITKHIQRVVAQYLRVDDKGVLRSTE